MNNINTLITVKTYYNYSYDNLWKAYIYKTYEVYEVYERSILCHNLI